MHRASRRILVSSSHSLCSHVKSPSTPLFFLRSRSSFSSRSFTSTVFRPAPLLVLSGTALGVFLLRPFLKYTPNSSLLSCEDEKPLSFDDLFAAADSVETIHEGDIEIQIVSEDKEDLIEKHRLNKRKEKFQKGQLIPFPEKSSPLRPPPSIARTISVDATTQLLIPQLDGYEDITSQTTSPNVVIVLTKQWPQFHPNPNEITTTFLHIEAHRATGPLEELSPVDKAIAVGTGVELEDALRVVLRDVKQSNFGPSLVPGQYQWMIEEAKVQVGKKTNKRIAVGCEVQLFNAPRVMRFILTTHKGVLYTIMLLTIFPVGANTDESRKFHNELLDTEYQQILEGLEWRRT